MIPSSQGIYRAQRGYFEQAYRSGVHGWPIEGVSTMVAAFLKTAGPGRGKRVLDIGCGEGRHTRAFAEAGFEAVGIDLQYKALDRARTAMRGADAGGRWWLLQADVFALPFAHETFDVLIDYGCLHHVRRSDTPRYLGQIAPLLRSNGYFLLSCFSTKFKHHPGERRTRDWVVHHGHYDRFFRRGDFAELFGDAFDLLDLREDRAGLYVFHNVLMRKKPTRGNGSTRNRRMSATCRS